MTNGFATTADGISSGETTTRSAMLQDRSYALAGGVTLTIAPGVYRTGDRYSFTDDGRVPPAGNRKQRRAWMAKHRRRS
jgi:hypothetical protein